MCIYILLVLRTACHLLTYINFHHHLIISVHGGLHLETAEGQTHLNQGLHNIIRRIAFSSLQAKLELFCKCMAINIMQLKLLRAQGATEPVIS